MGTTQKLKWDIKKFNQEVSLNYRDYKLRILEAFRNNTLCHIVTAECQSSPEMVQIVKELEVENVYKTLL